MMHYFPPTPLLDREFDEPDGLLVSLVQHGNVLHVDTVPSTGSGETDASFVAKWVDHYTPEYWAAVRARALGPDAGPAPQMLEPPAPLMPLPKPPPRSNRAARHPTYLPWAPSPTPPPAIPLAVDDLVSWEGRTYRVIGGHPVPGAVQVCSDDDEYLVLMSHMLTRQGPMWVSVCAARDAECATQDAA